MSFISLSTTDTDLEYSSDNGSPGTRKRWNWDNLHKSSQQNHPLASPGPSTSQDKRKEPDTSDNENIAFKKGKTVDEDNN